MPLNSLSSKSEKRVEESRMLHLGWSLLHHDTFFAKAPRDEWAVHFKIPNFFTIRYWSIAFNVKIWHFHKIQSVFNVGSCSVRQLQISMSVNETLKTISYGWVMHNENLFFYQFCLFSGTARQLSLLTRAALIEAIW